MAAYVRNCQRPEQRFIDRFTRAPPFPETGRTPRPEPTKQREATKEPSEGEKGQVFQVVTQGGNAQGVNQVGGTFVNTISGICEWPVLAPAVLLPRDCTANGCDCTSAQFISKGNHWQSVCLCQP